jgi:uncharacterized protein (UPF0218 family)
VTEIILKACLNPDIAVIDHRISRKPVKPIQFKRDQVKVVNHAGTISVDAQQVLQDAVTLNKKIGIVVEGEEDLLVLPLMSIMPTKSIIVYGQPQEGMVVVKLTGERRRWAQKFMTFMEDS